MAGPVQAEKTEHRGKTMKNLSAFITGTPRSGTTMLQLQLQKERIPESSVITVLVEVYKRMWEYGEAERKNFYWNNNAQECKDAIREVTQICINNALKNYKHNDIASVVLKCPEMSKYALSFIEIFPEVPLLVIMRDPRAVYLSLKNVRAKLGISTNPSDIVAALEPYYHGLYLLRSAKKLPENIHFIKYEDLIQGKIDILKKIAVKYNLQLHLTGGVEDSFDKNDPFYSHLYGKKMSAEGLNRYKDELKNEELQAIENKFSWFIDRFDYPPSAFKSQFSLRAQFILLLKKIFLYDIAKKYIRTYKVR